MGTAEARAEALAVKGGLLAETLTDFLEAAAQSRPRKPAGGENLAATGVAELPPAWSASGHAPPQAQEGPPAAAEAEGRGLGRVATPAGPGDVPDAEPPCPVLN
jgi:hypothetical protein